MAGGLTSQTNKTSDFIVPSNNFSYCDLPPLSRSVHTLTGLTACGGEGFQDADITCSTFDTGRGAWFESFR